MEERTNFEPEQSQEALDKATKRRQLEERRAAFYEERARKLEEEQRRAKEAQEQSNQVKQKMMALMRQRKIKQAA